MKNIIIKLITQRVPLLTHSSCMYLPTCSEYTILAIEKYGTIKGLIKGFKRILRCKPKKEIIIDLP